MAKVSKMLGEWLHKPGQVELPAASGDPLAVNPSFVMAVQGLTASTTEITVAGKGQIVINLSFAETLARLRT